MKKIYESIVSIFCWFSGITVFSFCAIFLLITGIFTNGRLFDTCIRKACRIILFSMGIRVNVINKYNIDTDNKYIFMMNHYNLFDPFVVYSNIPCQAKGLEEESHFKFPVYGWLLKRFGQIPVNRKSGRKAVEALKRAAEIIKNKKECSIVLFPEGTRTKTGRIGKFKKGGFHLALNTKYNILPLIQKGSYEIKKKGSWLIKPGKIDYIIEKPVSVKEFSRENINDLINKTQNIFLRYVE